MKKCCIEINGLPWHCFSIYYTSNEWHRILPNIIAYMKEHWDIYQYMLFLSSDRGDNIKLMFASSSGHPEDVQDKVSTFLHHLVDVYPSTVVDTMNYGFELWAHYPNNSIIKDDLAIPKELIYTQDLCVIGQLQSQLFASLLNDDASEDSRSSIALFLCMNLLRTCQSSELVTIFDNLEELSIEKINIEMNLMDAYWEYKFDDQEKEIVSQLLKEISRKYVLGGMKTGFHNMCVLISQQLNVSDMASIIGMSKIWYNNRILKDLISNKSLTN